MIVDFINKDICSSTKLGIMGNLAIKIIFCWFCVVLCGEEITIANAQKRDSINIATIDTTSVRIGRRQIRIINGWHGTRVQIVRADPWLPRGKRKGLKKEGKFRGHWVGVDVGINGFDDEKYDAYSDSYGKFMALNMAKSISVNINLLQYDISLQQKRNTIGLLTGLGLEWNNYRFDRDVTIREGADQIIEPVILDSDWRVKKSKLTDLYLTVPLLLEVQIPVRYQWRRIHLSVGMVGGMRLASHTKIKYKNNGNTRKDKDHDDFSINTFRYAGYVRVGYECINLFASYSFTPLFKDNKGPELTPYSMGITLISF